jgi:hypothetical protein
MRTHYEVLGLSEEASQATIRSTYLRLLQIYHPDHNSDPAAHRKTLEIIEAYSVVGDPSRRIEYDRSLHPARVGSAESEQPKTGERIIDQIVCQKCGTQNASLRISLLHWVASFIVVTRRGRRAGIWCERCRAKQVAIWSFVSGAFGWWGFPWGPIYTIPALCHNALGGEQDRPRNAALLRLVGLQLYEKGDLREALRALDQSTDLEKDDATGRFANELRAMPGSYAASRLPIFRFITALPSIAVVLAIALAISEYSRQPTGYASRYEGVSANTAPVPTPNKVGNSREKVNELVERLAEEIKANATPAGSHQVGTTTIYEYELDRSKYQGDPFDRIAIEIEAFLGDPMADGDGFASSAYFNAKLMGLSVAIINDFDGGRDVSSEVEQVTELGSDQRIRPWLSMSKYATSFKSLEGQLRYMVRQQQVGTTREERRSELKSLASAIENAKVNVQDARANDRAEDEHRWVAAHNRDVEMYNALVVRDKRSRVAESKADLDFNRCLDPAILMSKYEQVNLTSGAAEVDALPTN